MTEAVVLALIAASAALVAFIRMRRRQLSPALRREYAELADWAEREATLITNADSRIGQVAEQADATEGNAVLAEVEAEVGCRTKACDRIDRNPEKAAAREPSGERAMFSTNLGSRLRHLGWEDRPLSVVLASILIRARRAGIEESSDRRKGPPVSHAERILRVLDLAEARGRLPEMAHGGCLVPEEDPVRELVDRR